MPGASPFRCLRSRMLILTVINHVFTGMLLTLGTKSIDERVEFGPVWYHDTISIDNPTMQADLNGVRGRHWI